ncbi:MAG: GTP pyrophosphokinase family protein [Eubacteriales bacterium]|nr:GTP pyrophosphokinase family protein [Eubacteriales bacterium]
MNSQSNSVDNAERWESAMFLYHAALKNVKTKIDILNGEFKYIHNYNPIEHVKSRIKSPDSIMRKLQKNNHEVNIKNMVQYVHDIAGVRIICSFVSDIYKISRMLMLQSDMDIVQVKDYIAQPKPNGYKSLHLIVRVPIYMASGMVDTKVEIQIRTIAMDFWASLEHKIHYKFDGQAPEHIAADLKECADIVARLDARMLSLNDTVQNANRERQISFSGFFVNTEGGSSDEEE